MDKQISYEVAYGLPHKQTLLHCQINEGVTLKEAIEASGILKRHSDIDLETNKVGIWSRNAKLTDILRDGQRIEIYRPLLADPKEIRRRRAERAKEEGRADKVTGGRPKKLG